MSDWNLKYSFIDQVLDPIGVVIGLLVSIPIFWTWYELIIGRRRQHKTWLKKAIANQGMLPVVLVIDLLPGKSIITAIRHFIASDERLREIPEERIIKVERERQISPADMPSLAQEIQDAIAEVLRHGADELHVFFAGPGCASAMMGAELSNISCRVFIYQTGGGSNTYVNFGPLRHPRF